MSLSLLLDFEDPAVIIIVFFEDKCRCVWLDLGAGDSILYTVAAGAAYGHSITQAWSLEGREAGTLQ